MINTIATLAVPILQLWLLFMVWRELKVISRDSERREELKKQIRDFGMMFAAAADVPKPPSKKRPSGEILEI